MDLRLNWLGLYVSDFNASLHFYRDQLGISTRVVRSDFALFRTTGMTFEMFAGGKAPDPERLWGHGQAARPGIQVQDLAGTIEVLRCADVQFTERAQPGEFGEYVEFIAPDRLCWTLGSIPGHPASPPLSQPHLGWIELKVLRLEAQCAFYTQLFGSPPEELPDGSVLFRQAPGMPLLILKPGGEQAPELHVHQTELHHPPPHLLGFETASIQQSAAQLKSLGVPVLIDVIQRMWGGIEMIVSDPDGNPLQVVEYLPR